MMQQLDKPRKVKHSHIITSVQDSPSLTNDWKLIKPFPGSKKQNRDKDYSLYCATHVIET